MINKINLFIHLFNAKKELEVYWKNIDKIYVYWDICGNNHFFIKNNKYFELSIGQDFVLNYKGKL